MILTYRHLSTVLTLTASLAFGASVEAQFNIGGIKIGGGRSKSSGSKSSGSGFRIGGSGSNGPNFRIGGSKSDGPSFRIGGSDSNGPSFRIGGSDSNGPNFQIGGSKSGGPSIDLKPLIEGKNPLFNGDSNPITDMRYRGPKKDVDLKFGNVIIGAGSARLAIDPSALIDQPSWTSPIRPGKPIVCPPPGPDPICQPLPVDPTPVTPGPPAPPTDPAMQLTLEAQEAFADQNYELAIELMNQVVAMTPESATAYQFRALIHFAHGNYDEAAGDVYETILRGPLWTWDVIHPLYENHRTYTNQYRFLYRSAGEDDDSISKHFLLAYHHLVLGHLELGEQELRKVLTMLPSDPVTKQLLDVVVQTRKSTPVG